MAASPEPRSGDDTCDLIDDAVAALAERRGTWPGDDIAAIALIASLIDQAERELPQHVHDARANGCSWEQIARALATSPAESPPAVRPAIPRRRRQMALRLLTQPESEATSSRHPDPESVPDGAGSSRHGGARWNRPNQRQPGPQVHPVSRGDLAAHYLPGHRAGIVERQLLPVDIQPAYDRHRDLLTLRRGARTPCEMPTRSSLTRVSSWGGLQHPASDLSRPDACHLIGAAISLIRPQRYIRLQADARQAAEARTKGPGGQPGNGSDSSAASSHPERQLFGPATPGPDTTVRPGTTAGTPSPFRPASKKTRSAT